MTAKSVTRRFDQPVDTITLDKDARHRRRVLMVSDGGIEFLLDLPQARLLKHGDGLLLDDGRVVEVRAEPELLYKVKGRDLHHLLVLTWHMGNRHLPTQIMDDHILVARDHVIKSMLEGLGAVVTETTAIFDPEGGAYDDHHHHSGHSHD